MSELDKIREEKGGAAAMLLAWVVIFAALTLTGCFNKKFSCQYEDLGETIDYRQEFNTRGEASPVSRRAVR